MIIGCRKAKPESVPAASSGDANPKTQAAPRELGDVISKRKSWNPILMGFYGKAMPDFKVTDITGKEHSLSDYRGKNVMIVLWATWCRPCIEEIPHIMALREIMPADKLAIIAISNESAYVVKEMADDKKMNYTVVSHRGVLPEPFSSVKAIPSIFFIKPDGTLKVVVEGSTSLGEFKSIILAE
jgi:peroxiredoxin